MDKLTKPNENILTIYDECINNYSDKVKKCKLNNIKKIVATQAQKYDTLASSVELYKFNNIDLSSYNISNSDLVSIYTNKFAKKKAPGRKYYDKIMSLCKYGICPLCGVRTVSTLDHYLPKHLFPILSITPYNLIPSCRDCNTDKHEYKFTCASEETIHPYYDETNDETWLYCNLDKELTPTYFVSQPPKWDKIKYERVKQHFIVFKLNLLYSMHAAEEISNNLYKWKNLLNTTSLEELHNSILNDYESFKHYKLNTWKTALYGELTKIDLNLINNI